MHIGIVLHPYGDSTKGLEQYIFETTRAILEIKNNDLGFTVFVKGKPDTSGLPKDVRVVELPSVFFWHMFLLRWYTRIDTFVFFTESAPLLLWRKSIVVFLDAAYYYFGGTSLRARLTTKFLVWWRSCMMRYAKHVVTISEASKRDLVSVFNLKEHQASVIYPGFKQEEGTQDELRKPQIPFFMYVGPMKERKNVLRVVQAFLQFKEHTKLSHELYLVGRRSRGAYEAKVMDCIENSEYKNSIKLMTDVDDESLYRLYRTTTALVFPSLLEGFGLPVLEAYSVGCPVITSYTTSTSEVAGESGLFVNPENIHEISQKMTILARDEFDREQFKIHAKEQCKLFAWKGSGEKWHILFQDT